MTPECDIQALLLCFKLQNSQLAVMLSTGVAMLHQLVMFVIDTIVKERTNEIQ